MVLEIFFALNIIKNFMTDFTQENSHKPNRHLTQIFNHYFLGGFMLDFIAFFPFSFILNDDFLSNSFGSNIFLIKMIRLPRGLATFDSEEWFKFCNDCF